MGVFTNERKRNHHSYALGCKIPFLSSLCSDSYSSKRTKLSTSSNQAHDSSVAEGRVSVVSRFHQYPDSKFQIKREPHAPVRPSKFGGFQNSKSSGSKSVSGDRVVELTNKEWNRFRARYDRAKQEALESCRHINIDDDLVVIEDDEVVEIKDDEVIEIKDDEVIEIKDDEVVEVVNVEGEPAEDLSIEVDEITVDVRDEKAVDGEIKALSSAVVRYVGIDNMQLVSAEKMFESLSLTEKKDDLGLIDYKKMLSDVDRKYKKLDSLEFQTEINEKKRLAMQLCLPWRKVEVEAEDTMAMQLLLPWRKVEVEAEDTMAMQLCLPWRKVEVEAEDTKETFRKEMIELAFKPLTKDEEDQVTSALFSYPRWKLLVKHESSNIEITVDLLQCLRPKTWLNDEVINLYLELLKEREKREPDKFLKCHFFNTFFYKKLISGKDGYNFQSVRRWTSQRKLGYFIFDCDKIFVPIHKEIHWCLAVINKKEEKFQYLDSLGHADSRVLTILARYFADEVKDKSGKEIDISSWKQEFIEDLPEQENGFDCGVFMIKYTDFYSRDIGLCFNQEHMPYFRQRTAKEILNLKAE